MNRLDIDGVAEILKTVFAPWIVAMGLKPVAVRDNGADFILSDNRDLVHAGGVICGQASASAADTAAVLTLCALNGKFKPVTTIDLTCHFVRPLPPGEANIAVTVDSNGKRMAYARVEITPAGSDRVAVTFSGAFMYLD